MSEHPINTTNSDGAAPALSRAGEHRRAEILGELLGELESTRRGRAARKRLATAGGFGVLIAGAVVVALMQSRPGAPTGGSSPTRAPIAQHGAGKGSALSAPPEPIAADEIVGGVRIVRTDRSIVERWRAAAASSGAVIASGAAASSQPPAVRVVTSAGTSLVDFAPDPAAVARVTIRSLSDSELIDALVAIGRPAGIIRMGGKVWLSAAVTDEEIEKEQGRSRG